MDKIAIVKTFMAEIESRDPTRASRYLSDDFVFQGPAQHQLDKDDFLQAIVAIREAFPDWSFNLGEVTERGGRVRVQISPGGTHTRALRLLDMISLPATGTIVDLPPETLQFIFEGLLILEIRVEKARKGWMGKLLAELGIPHPTRALEPVT